MKIMPVRYLMNMFPFVKSQFEYVENVKKFANKLKRLNIDGFTNNHIKRGSYYVFDIPKMRTHLKMDDLPDGMDSDSDTDTH